MYIQRLLHAMLSTFAPDGHARADAKHRPCTMSTVAGQHSVAAVVSVVRAPSLKRLVPESHANSGVQAILTSRVLSGQ